MSYNTVEDINQLQKISSYNIIAYLVTPLANSDLNNNNMGKNSQYKEKSITIFTKILPNCRVVISRVVTQAYFLSECVTFFYS